MHAVRSVSNGCGFMHQMQGRVSGGWVPIGSGQALYYLDRCRAAATAWKKEL